FELENITGYRESCNLISNNLNYVQSRWSSSSNDSAKPEYWGFRGRFGRELIFHALEYFYCGLDPSQRVGTPCGRRGIPGFGGRLSCDCSFAICRIDTLLLRSYRQPLALVYGLSTAEYDKHCGKRRGLRDRAGRTVNWICGCVF